MKRSTKHWISLSAIVFAFGFTSHSLAQETRPKSQTETKTEKAAETAKKTTPPKTAPDLTEWKSLLDHLAVEARTVDSEEDPALLTAEVADAYWRFDPKRSKTLFTDAFERASSTPGSQVSMRKIL